MSKVTEWKEKYGFDKNTDAILVCVDEIDDLVEMVREDCNQWIPVSERLPEVTDQVMVCDIDGRVIDCCYWSDEEFCSMYEMGRHGTKAKPIPFGKITHWRPFPAPPTK